MSLGVLAALTVFVLSNLKCSAALNTRDGQQHFKTAQELLSDPFMKFEEWSPTLCKTQNCSAQILHIASKGFDEGAVEKLVEDLGIPATVVYLGQANHTQAIWSAYTQQDGALVYNFYPNVNQHGVSVLHLARAKIAPGMDFQPQRLAVRPLSHRCKASLRAM